MLKGNCQMRCEGLSAAVRSIRPRLHGAIYRPDSFVLMLRYCVNLKAVRYESTVDKSHRGIVAKRN